MKENQIPELPEAKARVIEMWQYEVTCQVCQQAQVEELPMDLEMQAVQSGGGLIYGPTQHNMGRRVDETLDASLRVCLSERGGRVLFEGCGRHGGLEINGDIQRLLAAR